TAVSVRPQPSWPAGRESARAASRSFRPRLKGIELAADGGSYRQDGGTYCRPDPPGTAFRRGRPRGSRPSPDAQSPAARRRQRTTRGLIVEILAVKAHCRAVDRAEGIERRRRMLTSSWWTAARTPPGAILVPRGAVAAVQKRGLHRSVRGGNGNSATGGRFRCQSQTVIGENFPAVLAAAQRGDEDAFTV